MIKVLPNTKIGKIRFFIIIGTALLVVAYFFIAPGIAYLLYQPKEGDIIFQSLPHADLVDAIEGVTDSPYSHCGVVVKENGKWVVNEAIGSVHSTPLYLWIARGRKSNFDVYRLKSEYAKYLPDFIKSLKKYQGRPYDFNYSMDDEYIYCSELAYKAFKDASKIKLGELKKLGQMNWKPFRKTIEDIEGGAVPLDRIMITPRHLSEADELDKVFSFWYG